MAGIYKLLFKYCANVFLFLLVFGFLLNINVNAASGINQKINFQGKVVSKTNGTNVTSGDYDFVFRLYTSVSGGSPIWTENWNSGTDQVAVTDGIFNVALGTHTSFPSTVDFNSDNIYLSVEYNADGEMSPRVQFTAVPYAFNAQKVGGLTVTNTVGSTLTIADGKTISFGNNFTTTDVGITLDQNLATTATATFAGLNVTTNKAVFANGIGVTGNINIGGTLTLTQGANNDYVLTSDANGNARWAAANTGTTYTASTGITLVGNDLQLNLAYSPTWTSTHIFTNGINVGSTAIFSDSVGIGTTNPSSMFQVSGSEYTTFTLSDKSAYYDEGLTGPRILLENGAGDQALISSQSNILNPGGTLKLQTYNNLGSLNDGITIRSSGKVGVGNINPNYNLDVFGDGGFSTNLNVGGTLILTQGANNGYLLKTDASGNSSWVDPSTLGLGVTYAAGSGLNLASNIFSLDLGSTNVWLAPQIFSNGIGVTGNVNLTNNLNVGGTSYFADKVGVGTISPLALLDINGTAKIIGSELITNGTFTGNANNWDLYDGAAYDTNNITVTNGGYIETNFDISNGKTYILTFTISNVNNEEVFFYLNNFSNYNDNNLFKDGTHSVTFTGNQDGVEKLGFQGYYWYAGSTWTIDNVSIKEISSNSPAINVIGFDGKSALSLGEYSYNNTALGLSSFASLMTGHSNSAFGNQSLAKNTSGYNNSAFGDNSLYSNLDGNGNSAYGTMALYFNTTGSFNDAFGNEALLFNTTGFGNSAFGRWSLTENTIGYNNSAFGHSALEHNSIGDFNTAIGNNALDNNISGSNNTALGQYAGSYLSNNSYSNTGPENSLYLGSNTKSGSPIGNSQNEIVIGYDANGLGSNSVVLGSDVITKTVLKGKVGIGNTNPTEQLTIGTGINTDFSVGSTNNKFFFGTWGSTVTMSINRKPSDGTIVDSTKAVASIFMQSAANASTIAFLTSTVNNSNAYERMRITESGNVGIGTTNPAGKLEVFGSSYPVARFTRSTSSVSSSYTAIVSGVATTGDMMDGFGSDLDFVIQDSAGVKNPIAIVRAVRSGADNSGALHLVTYDNGAQSAKLSILPGGNIGIGTTVPSYKLDVFGDGGFSTNLTIGGTLSLGQGASDGYVLTSDASGNAYWAQGIGDSGGTTYTAGSGLSLVSDVFSLNLGSTNVWLAPQIFSNGIGVSGTASFSNDINLINNYITNGIQPGNSNFVGYQSGLGASVASYSNFFGYQSGLGASEADNSNFFGYQAGFRADLADHSNFFGSNAGAGATSAYDSNFFGSSSGQNATNAHRSNFIGSYAGNNATSAASSNFIGYSAGRYATSASFSNFIGEFAGIGATNAFRSNFMGYYAGQNAASASYSNIFGWYAGIGASNAHDSNFFGQYAGAGATNAYNSNFIGQNAGQNAFNATASNFFGLDAGRYAFGASGSNFIGEQAGIGASEAYSSNFIGYQAGQNAANAIRSNFMGPQAGVGASAASYSNFIGYNAGIGASKASSSNFIGSQAGLNAVSATNSNFIGSSAGQYAINATYSNFMGNYAGRYAYNASYSNFFGYNAGVGASNANNSNFFGQNTGLGASNAYDSNFLSRNSGNNAIAAYQSNFFGNYAGSAAFNAHDSNFFGNYAGVGASNAYQSNFFGSNAGIGASKAYNSNFFGIQTGWRATDAHDSNFFGDNAGLAAANASNSNFFGYQAGRYATEASFSNFFGYRAGIGATYAGNSNFFGWEAGQNANNTSHSNYFGYRAGNYATNATRSNFFGYNAGQYGINASYSNFFGNNAGNGATNAANSIFIGSYAGYNDSVNTGTTGTAIAIGQYAGTGGYENSIAIGRGVINSANNQANFGNILYMTGLGATDTQSSTPIANGKVGIGIAAPSYSLDVVGNGRFSTNLTIGGTLSLTQGASDGYVLTSDASGNAYWATAGTGSASATNGLQLISSSVGLGGTLTQNTSIGTSSFSLSFLGIGDSQSLYLDSIGRVGVGTTNPTQKLTVYKGFINLGDSTDGLRFQYGDGYGTVLGIDANGSSYNDVDIRASIGIGSGLYVNTVGKVGIGTTDITGKFTIAGSSGSGRSVSIDNREIKFRGDGVAHMSMLGPDTGQSYITFQNTSGNSATGTAGTDLLTILSDGKVGIGTAAPSQRFQITTSGADSLQYSMRLQNPNNGTGGAATGIAFVNDTDADLAKGGLVYVAKSGYGQGDFLFLQNSQNDLSVADLSNAVMAITNAGYVGIGITDPLYNLDVVGSGHFSGDFYVDGYLTFAQGAADGYVLTSDVDGNAYWAPGASGSASFTSDINMNNFYITNGTQPGHSNFIGNLAGIGATSATFSNFMGYLAGSNAVSATGSNFFGLGAGSDANNAASSNFFGGNAGAGATDAVFSNFFGYLSGMNADAAAFSNFFGVESGFSATNAGYSNFFGASAGAGATNAANSIFIGNYAGYNDAVNNTINDTSIVIGQSAGTGGYKNSIALGRGVINTAEEQANIGNILYLSGIYNSDTQSGDAQVAGKVGIGTTNPLYTLDVFGDGQFSTNLTVGGTVSFGNDINLNNNYLTNGTQPGNSNFVGYYAGLRATNASYSNFFGINAGVDALNASSSNFFGYQAGVGASNASGSNFFGYTAGKYASYASNSNFFGYEAGLGASNAYSSNFFGQQAGVGASNAYSSNFFGYEAGENANSAMSSNYFGMNAGTGAAYASNSNFFGYQAGLGASNANGSNFFGQNAGKMARFANNSNFFGTNAGNNAANAQNAIFIGNYAGYNDTVDTGSGGSSAIAIGKYAGTGGFKNSIAIGRGVINTAEQQANIGNVLYINGIYNSDTQSGAAVAGGEVGIGATGFDATNPEKLLIDTGITTSVNALVAKGTINNYFQMNIKNLSTGNSASSDIVATADNGSETTNYINMGINNSGYTSAFVGNANDAYMYSAGNNLLIGNATANKDISFFTNGTNAYANEKMRITSTGNVGIGNTAPTGKFQINVGTSQAFIVASNGNVGVGLTNPIYKFHVLGNGISGVAYFTNTNTGKTVPTITIQNGSSGTGFTGSYINFVNGAGVRMGRIRNTNTTTLTYGTTVNADFAEYVHGDEHTDPTDLVAYHGDKFGKAIDGQMIAGTHSNYATYVGNEAIADEPNAFPLAMIGIVDVKVSSIYGNISPGDPIATSPFAGVGAKSNKAQRIVGRAMESYSNSDPNHVGSIKIIVNVNYDDPNSGFDISLEQKINVIENKISDIQNINGILIETKELRTSKISPLTDSMGNPIDIEILGNVNVGGTLTSQVLQASILNASVINADKIAANQIDGLDIYTNKVDLLSEKYSNLKNQVDELATTSAVLGTASAEVNNNFLTEFINNPLFKGISELWGNVFFKGKVNFETVPTFNNQTAGYAIVNNGDDSIDITFDTPLDDTPVVNVTMLLDNEEGVPINTITDQNYSYFITKKSNNGFTIILNKKATTDLKFSWSALVIKDIKTYQKPTPTPTLMPTSTLAPTAIPTLVLEELTPTPTIEASESASLN